MLSEFTRWQRRIQDQAGHQLAALASRFFTRLSHIEYGLRSPEVTGLECRHAPLAGRRAVQISDLHLDAYKAHHDVLLSAISDLRPDWIFVTGDLLTLPRGLPHLFRFLSGLRRLAPVFITLGNHDHASGVPLGQFLELADRHKIHLLINQAQFIPVESGELGIIGLDDPSTFRADVSCIPPAVSGRFTVLLAHAPSALELLDPHHAVDLILCGHSHGGQWRFPFVRPFWLPSGCHGRAHGHYTAKGHHMYVNRGIGWSLLPIRWNCPPEIVLIEWTESLPVELDPTASEHVELH